MKVTVFGARGSLPVCGKDYLEFGGNTTCFLIEDQDGNQLIVDGGTGLRNLGNSNKLNSNNISIVLTHFHWDHIQGFPFFSPAYNPESQIQITALKNDIVLSEFKSRIESQMKPSFFPVGIYDMGSKISLNLYNDDQLYQHSGFITKTIELNHPGGCSAIKVTDKYNQSIVIMTDHEHENLSIDKKYIDFCGGTDILIHDCHYTETERKGNINWGHSSFDQALILAEAASVNSLIMTHHNPDYQDQFLRQKEIAYQTRFPGVTIAREGQTYETSSNTKHHKA